MQCLYKDAADLCTHHFFYHNLKKQQAFTFTIPEVRTEIATTLVLAAKV